MQVLHPHPHLIYSIFLQQFVQPGLIWGLQLLHPHPQVEEEVGEGDPLHSPKQRYTPHWMEEVVGEEPPLHRMEEEEVEADHLKLQEVVVEGVLPQYSEVEEQVQGAL